MTRQIWREFQEAYPDVPMETRVQEKTVQSFEKLQERLARGELGSVGAVIRDRRGFVLMQRHDPATGWPPDAWAVPGGGVMAGETFEEAVERETREETGLRVEAVRPLFFLRQKFFCGRDHAEYPFVLYEARRLDDRPPRPKGGEVVEIRWFHRVPRTAFDRDVLVRFV